jgi:hypothetical protein
MRTRLRSKVTLLFIVCAALLTVPAVAMAITADPSGTTAPAPTIQSDKADYAPGELVTLTGSNWQPGESVHINVNDDQGQTWSYDSNPDVQADANGNISHTFNLPSSFVATYKVTATGAQSGVATTSFTDGNLAFALATSGNAAPSNLTWSVNWDQWQGTGQNPNNTCAGTRSANGTANYTGNTLTSGSQPGINDNASAKPTGAQATGSFASQYTLDYWSSSPTSTTPLTSAELCKAGTNGPTVVTLYAHFKVSNTAPVLAPIGNKTVNEGVELSFTASATDSDVPANTITYSLAAGTGCTGSEICSVPSGASIGSSSGDFSWTPDFTQAGTYRFKVVASDGSLSDSKEVTITVNEVNQAPVLAAIGSKNASFGTQLSFTAQATDADLPANNVTFSLENGTGCTGTEQCNVPSGANISSGGAFSWTPGATGTYKLKVKVSDDGSPNLSDDEQIIITVAPASTTTTVQVTPGSQQYSDLVTLSATVNGPGTPTGSVQFTIDGNPVGSPQTLSGGSASLSNQPVTQAPGVYSVNALYISNSPNWNNSASGAQNNLTVTKENATLGYTGPYFAATSSATATSANVTLNALVTQAADGNTGNLTNAKVEFALYKSTNLTMATPDKVCDASVATNGVVTSTGTCSLELDSWTVVVRFKSESYFNGPQSDPAVLTVYQPTTDKFLTGGGWIVDPSTNNLPVAISSANNHGNFGFTVRYKKGSTTVPQGQSVYVFRGADGYDYIVKSNAWTGGALAFPTTTTAGFSGKANVTVINPATGLAVTGLGGGNYSYRVDATDNGLPGTTDKYTLSIYTPTGVLYHQAGTTASQITLGGGNIVVHSTTTK